VLIPGPDTRVVELRVHGVPGTTPEGLLETMAVVEVAGDGAGRVVRPADRLRRPAPGPVLRADGRPLPRTLEGYVWGGLAGGLTGRAVWALLAPFTLANAASWMLPPAPADSRTALGLAGAGRALLRLAGVLLTVLLVVQLAVVSVDLLAAQCLAPDTGCLGGGGWRSWPVLRPALGVLPVLVVVWGINRSSTVDWRVRSAEPVTEPTRRGLSGLPGVDRPVDPDAAGLRAVHVAAGLSAAALLAFGGPLRPAAGVLALTGWTVAAVLLLGCLLLALLGRADRLGPALRRGLVALATLVLLAVPATDPVGPLPGTAPTVQGVAAALIVVCLLLGLVLAPAALLARRQWATLPRSLRPWAGGWLAAPVLALAALRGSGAGVGVGVVARAVLGGTLPVGYAELATDFGAVGVLIGLGLLVGLGLRRLPRRAPAEATALHEDRPADADLAGPAWRSAGNQRRHAHHVLLAVTAALVVGAIAATVLRGYRLLPVRTAPLGALLGALGVVALIVLALALLVEVYRAERRPDATRRLGSALDLCAFWPRTAHPLVPPSYAGKVVPELADRAAEHLAEPSTRVVLTGVGPAGVLVCAAATRLLASRPAGERARLGLLLAGSPVRWAYARAFPAVLPHSGLLELFTDLDGRWRTLCRGTDPLGGGLTTWDRQVYDGRLIGVGFHPDGAVGALPPAVSGPTGALVLGGDHWCPDPARGPFGGRRWAPGVQRHADYPADPEWDRAVACAAGMESPTQTSSPPVVFRLPGRNTATG
jgi:hypothetical protein